MRKRPYTKMVREGKYVAEVDIELIDMDEGWSPYLSLDDAKKLDGVRQALRRGEFLPFARCASACAASKGRRYLVSSVHTIMD